MDKNLINFASLSHLAEAKSKKFLKKLFEEAFRLRKNFESFKQSNMSPLLSSIEEALSIDENKA